MKISKAISIQTKSNKTSLYCGNKPLLKINAFLHSLDTRGLSRHTVRAYRYDLLIFLRWLSFSDHSFSDVNKSLLLAFISYQNKSNISPLTTNRRLLTVEMCYQFCFDKKPYDWGGTESGLAMRTRTSRRRPIRSRSKCMRLRVKTSRLVIRPLTPAEVLRFLESLEKYRDKCIVYLMLFCGLRSMEIISLNCDAIRIDERWIRVKGKRDKERVLPIPDLVIELIDNYERLERPTKSESSFFTILQGKRRGKAMTPEGLRSLFRKHRKKSRVYNANPHRFRHTFGANMAEASVPLPVIQKLMGHSDPETTLKYIEISPVAIAESFFKAQKKIRELFEKK